MRYVAILPLCIFALTSRTVYASEPSVSYINSKPTIALLDHILASASKYRVGDKATYNITANYDGTLVEEVIMETPDSLWVRKSVDLFAEHTVTDTLVRKADGFVLMQLQDGVEIPLPTAHFEVLETRKEPVSVPAGTFESRYVRAKVWTGLYNVTYDVWSNTRANLLEEGALRIAVTYPTVGTITFELASFERGRESAP